MGIIEGALPRVGAASANPTAEGVGKGYGSQWARFRYDFAVEGGAVGSIALASSGLPANAVVLGGFLDVITPLTSGGAATAGLSLEGAGDLVAATVISGAPWDSTGRKNIIPAATGATSVKTTVTRIPALVVAVAALTAGVFDLYVEYLTVA